MGVGAVPLFLCGDVMPGCDVDRIMPHPCDPTLREWYIHHTEGYVALAEAAPDIRWLRAIIDRTGAGLGTGLDREADGTLALQWERAA